MFLGIDCGTSGLKALLMDERGAVVATSLRVYAPDHPHPLWSEQDPDVWRAAMFAAIGDLKSQAGSAMAGLKAIGFSGQMHSAVLVDRADRPVRPALHHNDGRAYLEARELGERRPDLAAIVGVKPMAGFTGPKLPWLRRHEPDVFARIDGVLWPKDYLRLALCGNRGTDMSDAAGSWWLDEAARAWSSEAVEACGADMRWLPPLAEGSDAVGRLLDSVADELGLPRGVVIAAGGGDAAVGAVAFGAIADGDAFISLGTAMQLVATTDQYRSAPEKLVHSFAHALPGRWYAMAAMLNGAGTLAFASRLLGASVADLEREAAAGYAGPGELMVLPYLSGERTPLDDPNARGVIFGLSETTSRADVVRAVMEGVAFALADARDCLAAAGAHLRRVGLHGGGARSDLWTRMIAAATGFTITRMRGGEAGPALGAARLARLAFTGEPPAAVCSAPTVEDVTEPDERLSAIFAAKRARFASLYRALKPEFPTQ